MACWTAATVWRVKRKTRKERGCKLPFIILSFVHENVIYKVTLSKVCYSWWVLSCLAILDKVSYIQRDKLIQFILEAQDPNGGIADRPDDLPDVFHTLFGIAGLSLLGYPGLEPVDPRYCMPVSSLSYLRE